MEVLGPRSFDHRILGRLSEEVCKAFLAPRLSARHLARDQAPPTRTEASRAGAVLPLYAEFAVKELDLQ